MTQAQFDALSLLLIVGLFASSVLSWRRAPRGDRARQWAIATALIMVWATIVFAWNLFGEVNTPNAQRPVSAVLAVVMIVTVAIYLGALGYAAYQALKSRA